MLWLNVRVVVFVHAVNTHSQYVACFKESTCKPDTFMMIPFLENKFHYEIHKLPGKNDYFWLKNSALHVKSLLPSIHYWSALSNDLGLNSKFEEVGTPYRLSINVGPLYSYDGVRLYLYGTAASNGPIVHLSDVTWMNMEHWGSNNWQGKIEVVCSERTLPLLPVCALMAGNRENFTFFTCTYSERTLSEFEFAHHYSRMIWLVITPRHSR